MTEIAVKTAMWLFFAKFRKYCERLSAEVLFY